MPKLIITRDGVNVREYPLEGERITIGRRPDNDIFINDQTVSSEHAAVSLLGEPAITDLDSTNGTYVNGSRVKKQTLHHGDRVRIGQAEMRFVDEEVQEFGATVVLGAATGGGTARLQVLNGAKKGSIMPLEGPRTALGKPGEPVAVVLHEGSRYQLLPMVKSGAIRVNDQPVAEAGAPLQHDDVITIGPTRIRFEQVG